MKTYKDAFQFNRENECAYYPGVLAGVRVDVIDFPKKGDRYENARTRGTAWTNSRLEPCIAVSGLASSVPFKHITFLD